LTNKINERFIFESLTLNKIRKLEAQAKALGLEERVLIENASSSLFQSIDSLSLERRTVVVAGRGNNGADVLSCARKLFGRGYNVKVALLEERPLGKEAFWQKTVLEKIRIPMCSIKQANIGSLKILLEGCDFILEGILGIGIKGEVSSFLKEAIALINEAGKTVISCDIPSGLSPDEGAVFKEAIKADYTITFIAAKKGFFINQGTKLCGKIFVVDIGISRQILEEAEK